MEYAAPYLNRLIPTGCVSVENANEMAHCLQQIKTDGEMMKYCAALDFSTNKAALRFARVILEKYNSQQRGGRKLPYRFKG